jgi:chemotaxis protein CheX
MEGKWSPVMALALSHRKGESTKVDILSSDNLKLMDETVAEVFGMMLGIPVAKGEHTDAAPPTQEHDDRTALVGFAGTMSGVCEVHLSMAASLAVTSAMMDGATVEEESDAICDAVGELCNMLAGGWKNRLPGTASQCALSLPTVVAGKSYQLHRKANLLVDRRSYLFGEHILKLTLAYDPS